LLHSIRQVVLDIEHANDLSVIAQLRKLSGSQHHFRLRVGEYRIGLVINNDVVEFVRCLHRREIYRFFP
jgi:mRNA interferase RelE/StbE